MTACILIIEDDFASRKLVKYLIESAGYSTLLAEDGRTGVGMAVESKPDLVICDLQMPLMNGYEVVRRLRETPALRCTPMIAVTAFSMTGDRKIALRAGFDGHITKPITPEIFVQQIEAFLPPDLRGRRPAFTTERGP